MKNIVIIIFTFLSVAASAQKNIYESDKFDELSREHQNLAIIPFLTNLELKDNIPDMELRGLEKKEGYAVQDALETYFSKRKKKKKFSVEFQNIKNTNAILQKNNITYENIDVHSVKELCNILGVDGLISGTLDLNVLLSKGVPTEFSLLDYINGDANYGRIGVKISDGATGKLLWKYEKRINKKSGKNTNDLIELMMKLASRKFPYDRERPRDRKKS
ncbi:hypothetical protein EHW67_12535 [Arenibacter aquaticus]|uniref:Uncharacterized protein n=1 Tax=Arenibacter aquaticus TaxID=2489054 RepID=A0A430K1Q5_9FLAO|nr:hypothetical protein [Arenibacter aquaticus]RTE53005.1 hypothetical protein EHW67_12535 [Arenibacter aquaticus]